MNIDRPSHCICDPNTFQTCDHIIHHCPAYDSTRHKLERWFPRLTNPCFSLSGLFDRTPIPPVDKDSPPPPTACQRTISWLDASGAFTKSGLPRDEHPWKPPWVDRSVSPLPDNTTLPSSPPATLSYRTPVPSFSTCPAANPARSISPPTPRSFSPSTPHQDLPTFFNDALKTITEGLLRLHLSLVLT